MIFRNFPVIRRKLTGRALVLLAGLVCLFNAGYSQTAANYLNHDELTAALKAIAGSGKDLTTLESIGKTAEGRDIWMMTIAKAGAVPVADRPALLIAANFEGDHLIGSSLSLEVAKYLVNGYSTDESIKASLNNHVFYILPRSNPDGAETMFAKIKSGSKTNTTPFDADNDARLDEDGPEDLNNDGQITVMRVKDDNGLYCIDPEEPMLMKKAEPAKGQRGEYSIYPEGIDNDKDGFINEDFTGGTDLNRNFMHAYPYFRENAGKHMASEKETRAILDWMLKHKNIAMVLTFGESDNLIVPPTGRGQMSSDRPLDLVQFAQAAIAGASRTGMISEGGRGRGRFMMGDFPGGMFSQNAPQETSARSQRQQQTAATTINSSDLDYFNKVSEKYKEVTGIKTQPVLRNPEGAFFQYAYFQLGVPAFSTPGWGLTIPADSSRRQGRNGAQRPGGTDVPSAGGGNFAAASGGGRTMGGGSGAQAGGQQDAAAQAPGIDAVYLKHLSAANINGFVKWQPVKHPELGDVEIGGFTPTEISNPPANQIAELGASHAKFALYLSTLFADIKLAKTEVTNEGGGLFRIKAEISNEGFLPTAMRQGVQARSVKPTMVQLEVKPEQIVSGSSKTNFFQGLDGSGKRQKYEWLIKGKAGDQIELKVVAQKGGTDMAKITLK